jgi:hypothetical protein
MEELIKSLPIVLRAAGVSPEVTEVAILAVWRHVAGDGLRDHAVPLRLEGRTLFVAVADPIWQKQLASMAGQLLFRLNSALGQSLVSRIELIVDGRVGLKKKADEHPAADLASVEVPLELYSAANAIQDSALRKTFLKAATTSLKRREQH